MTGIERLREHGDKYQERLEGLANDMRVEVYAIADQIERERACDEDAIENVRLIVGGVIDDMELHVSGVEGADDSPVARWARELRDAMGGDGRDPAEDVSMSAYDLLPQDEREAIAWVREHGGIESVKKLLDWVVGHCSTKQQLDFDFWLSGRVMHELGFEEDMADRDEVGRRLLARLMPEGMEWLVEAWPRFEDDAPVKLGDMALIDGYVDMVEAVQIWIHGKPVIYGDGGSQQLEKGERVRRPAPKVLDADGAEIREGDTVYLLPGDWCDRFPLLRCHEWDAMKVLNLRPNHDTSRIECVTSPSSVVCYPYPSQLTHRAPVLAADGMPLEAGQTVWDVESGTEYEVVGIHTDEDTPVRVMRTDGSHLAKAAKPSTLAHERPVLDADGVPIKVGDTVWYVPTPNEAKECKVEELPEREKGDRAVCLRALDGTIISCPTRYVTHEHPDSWERLEEDAEKDPCGYFGFDGEETCGKCPASGKNCEQTMAQDFVRRCRELAERERGE